MKKHLSKGELAKELVGIDSRRTIEETENSLQDIDTSEEFLHMCIEYRNEKINEDLLNKILPITAFSLMIRCPFYVGNRKESAKFVNIFGMKEREAILTLLRSSKYRSLSTEDLTLIVNNENLRITPDTLAKVLDFFSEEASRESAPGRPAVTLVDKYYEFIDSSQRVVITSSNNAVVAGKDNYRVYSIKFTDEEELSDAYFSRFRDSMFINGITSIGRSENKNVLSSSVIVKSNGIFPILIWKIPYNILDMLGETPESMLKKYISKNFFYLINGDYFNFPEYRNTTFCPYCGYNQTECCKAKK